MKEYLQELEEMEERVEKRPLLLEQATQVIDISHILGCQISSLSDDQELSLR